MEATFGQRKKIVAVFDDDRDLLDIYSYLLEEDGYEVVLYSNCNDVVAKMKELLPNIILMDNWIPVMGGVAAIEEIRKEEELRHIPIILVSANNDVEKLAEKAGADGAIAKPFEFSDLLCLIAKLSA
ncbi:MAG: response regulator [Pedobacter sp.]|uniref:response regulator n=1 Tax=Pedobacter sp. TaxID=1411316 RepID=UPI002808F189|nr:response regulator [Pedobacter sp.]MDQ8005400.1 response regulator [Pedobacter sp.]